jgi:hypothetical protein
MYQTTNLEALKPEIIHEIGSTSFPVFSPGWLLILDPVEASGDWLGFHPTFHTACFNPANFDTEYKINCVLMQFIS